MSVPPVDKAASKPYAESCDQNREPIFAVIEPLLRQRRRVLEIGSGTGQHAVYFAALMPHLLWQCSDRAENLPGIRLWLEEAGNDRLPPPLELDVTDFNWSSLAARFDAVFTANSLHIMDVQAVAELIRGCGLVLAEQGDLLIYGPFNYHGDYTSDSNRQFDRWLKSRDPSSGIRDFEWLLRLAEAQGLILQQDYAMPANNRILHFQKR